MALTTDLHPYQHEGVDLCLELGFGILAYEQGLGKTICGIAIIEDLLVKPDINFALIVVPSNLRYQWAQAIAKFTDVDTRTVKVKGRELTIPTEQWCVVVDGDKAARASLYKLIDESWPNYVIVSYEQVVTDYRSISNLGAECIVADELSYIKGFTAQRSKKMKALGRRAQFTFGLTGTPIENKPEELYSQMQFIEPGFLGSFESFDTKYIVRGNFGEVLRYRNLDVLHKKMKAVMSRKTRLDPDVAPYLPEVQHHEQYVSLPTKTWRLYNKISKEITADLALMQRSGNFDLASYYAGNGGDDMTEQGKIMAKVLALQMLCDDWTLIVDSAAKYVAGENGGSKYAHLLHASGVLEGLEPSAKLAQIVEDVTNILESHPKNKIIIFSFFTGMVDRIQAALPYGSVQYTGAMSSGEKAAARDQFQNDPDCRLFIATDAGAYGVDLPQANYLLNFDEVDSAGKMDQRNARHVRAGSEHKSVSVWSYLALNSIEVRKHQRLILKRRVASAAIDGKGAGINGEIEWDLDPLSQFLAESQETSDRS